MSTHKRGFTPSEINGGHRRSYKFLTGFTITEVLVVVVILAILASILLPGFQQFVRRSRIREVRAMFELIRAAAKYYDPKYGLDNLRPAEGQPAIWRVLEVALPENRICDYIITGDVPPAPDTTKTLEVWSDPGDGGGSRLLYTYVLPDGPGDVIEAHPDAKYLIGIKGLPQ